jgi:hypothetical protein
MVRDRKMVGMPRIAYLAMPGAVGLQQITNHKGVTVMYIGKNKEQLMKQDLSTIKGDVGKQAWVSLEQYFDGKGNGPEAKVACVVIGTLAREEQSKNNSRQLDLLEKRLLKNGR